MQGIPGNPGSSSPQQSFAPNPRRLIPGTVRPSGAPRRMRTMQWRRPETPRRCRPVPDDSLCLRPTNPRRPTHPDTQHYPRWNGHPRSLILRCCVDRSAGNAEPITPQHPGRHQHVDGVLAAAQAVDENHGGCAWLALDPPAGQVDARLPAGKPNSLIVRHRIAGQVDGRPIVVEDDPIPDGLRCAGRRSPVHPPGESKKRRRRPERRKRQGSAPRPG